MGKSTKNWQKNTGNWVQNIISGSIKNTKPDATWLSAGWTGYWMIEKTLKVTLREIIGLTGRGKGVDWGHPGVLFHYEDKNNWEGIYFRPHETGKPIAANHRAFVNGESKYGRDYKLNFPNNGAWFQAKITVTKDKWTLVAGGATISADRFIKGIPGGVGVMN